MKTGPKILAAVLVIAGLILFNVIAGFAPVQIDATSEKLYSLSDGTKGMISRLEEPVTVRLYFSRSLEGVPVFYKNFADRVQTLLRQYEASSAGKVRLEVVDPRPDTPEEDAATKAGLQPQATPEGNFYLGLLALQADQDEALPVLDPRREGLLEYDISQLIYRASLLDKPKVGVITSLFIFGGAPPPNPMMPQPPQERWILADQFEALYQFEKVEGDKLPDDLDVLMLIHPDPLSDAMAYAVDQFILSGKPVFMALDPSCGTARQANPMMMMQQGSGGSSDLPRLLPRYGIEFNPAEVVGDLGIAARVYARRGETPIAYPPWLDLRTFAGDTPATQGIKQVMLLEAGSFTVKADSGLKLTPLLETTDNAGVLPSSAFAFGDPNTILRQFKADGQKRTLAGLISGKFRTAFPDGPPPPPAPAEGETPPPPTPAGEALKESKAESTVFLIADADFLADRNAAEAFELMPGYRQVRLLNDNLPLAFNVVDQLSGSRDLLSLRGKGNTQRSFTLVEELYREATERYQSQLEAVEQKLELAQSRLTELQQQQPKVGVEELLASPEVRAEIEKVRQDQADFRAERRGIQRKLRESVEGLKLSLASANLTLMPLLVAFGGIAFFVQRGLRKNFR